MGLCPAQGWRPVTPAEEPVHSQVSGWLPCPDRLRQPFSQGMAGWGLQWCAAHELWAVSGPWSPRSNWLPLVTCSAAACGHCPQSPQHSCVDTYWYPPNLTRLYLWSFHSQLRPLGPQCGPCTTHSRILSVPQARDPTLAPRPTPTLGVAAAEGLTHGVGTPLIPDRSLVVLAVRSPQNGTQHIGEACGGTR